ncbi:MAG: HIT family protein [Erysipelotrichaceae bacterium]
MQTCIGCRLTKKEFPVYLVYEDEETIVILDHDPVVEGHLLVFHKTHALSLAELSNSQQASLFATIAKMETLIQAVYQPKGIFTACHSFGFDEVTHLHYHVMPRFDSTEFASFFTTSKGKQSGIDFDGIVTKLRDALNQIEK